MTKKSFTARATDNPAKSKPGMASKLSKLDVITGLLERPNGASIDELVAATSWQKHSVRGALAGSLKKKGHAITSEVANGVRRYRIAGTEA